MPIPSTVQVGGIIAPGAVVDTYPVTDPKYGLGGLRTVSDYSDLNLIPNQRLQEGMMVYVSGGSTPGYYSYINSAWTFFTNNINLAVAAASGNWNSVYTTVKSLSDSWEETADITEIKADINNIAGVSGRWDSNYTTTNTNSALWASNYSYTNANSANYILDGGNTKGSNIVIGTNDAFNLNLETNNNTRISLLSSGEVIINPVSATPSLISIQNALNVRGTAVVYSDISSLTGLSALSGSSPGQFSAGGMLIGQNEGGAYIGRIGIRENSWQVLSGTEGVTWTARMTSSNRRWLEVAMSSDGRIQAAIIDGGQIYTSYDYGVTWTARESNRTWRGIAMSSDGRIQVGVVYGGRIYTSYDYGVTWMPVGGSDDWTGVAMSSDGRVQLVTNQGVYVISFDYGQTWSTRNVNIGKIAMSSDGRVLFAIGGSLLYTSYDYGVTWTARESSRSWYRIAMSSDGRIMTATVSSGQIYTSYDYGVTWTARLTDSPRAWRGIAMSSDGRIQVANVASGQIYTSYDYGVAWTARGSNRNWFGIAMSSDGRIMTAAVNSSTTTGYLYTSYATTVTPNPITILGSISSTAAIFASGGNSDQWNSNYSYTNANSGNFILDGGNTKGSNIVIGTNDNFDLAFETNGTRKLVISNTGSISAGNNPTTSFNSGVATGDLSFAVNGGIALGDKSFAEGNNTKAVGEISHAEGDNSIAYGVISHAENSSKALGLFSHSEGKSSVAVGEASHAEGVATFGGGYGGHTEGVGTRTSNIARYISYNNSTRTFLLCADQIGKFTSMVGQTIAMVSEDPAFIEPLFFATIESIDIGNETLTITTITFGGFDSYSGYIYDNSASGAHAEGYHSIASANYSHAEGQDTLASGEASHAEGYFTAASGQSSHAEGYSTKSHGQASHAEGQDTLASGDNSHAEGSLSIAFGIGSHAEGNQTQAVGAYSHAAGLSAQAKHDRTWIWHGSTNSQPVSTTRTDQFMVSAAGGIFFPGNVGIGTDNNDNALTVTGLISTLNDRTSKDWSSTYTTVNANSASWEESSEILPTVTNYLSTNNVLMLSATVTSTLSVGGTIFTSNTANAIVRFSSNVGNGSGTSFNIPHNFNTNDITVAVYDNITNVQSYPRIALPDLNTVNLQFATPPSVDQFRVIVLGSLPSNRIAAFGNTTSVVAVEKFQFRTTNFNATTGYHAVDTTSGVVRGTLPASPTLGDTLIFIDPYNTWSSNYFVLERNGNNIESVTEDLSADASGFMFRTVFVGSTIGWRVYSN